ncbi:hypothetical protein C6I21_02400 [Alkalicoccus urumqiensis]|uniref:Uncharacterized protein n=1 Tax=Alkalicoccus urumqiensis TaxID=1548213 RepID=A0A2P6MKK8_ALKUR|nr:hypothetical protein C6I21_02400 [Alkalicoccus urumqiensis]
MYIICGTGEKIKPARSFPRIGDKKSFCKKTSFPKHGQRPAEKPVLQQAESSQTVQYMADRLY